MDITVSQEEIKDYLKLKTLSRLSALKEKLRLFEQKYRMTFSQFEKMVLSTEEQFETWDDYIEWKAIEGMVSDLTKKLGEIESAGHIKIIK